MTTNPPATPAGAGAARLQAATITGAIWAAIITAGGQAHHHYPHTLDPVWLATLPLPTMSAHLPGQPVALLDEDHDEFDRYHDPGAARQAYAARPRTRVHENINRGTPHAWYSLVADHLGRLSRSRLQAVCSVFESAHGDETLGAHYDTWYSAIIQMRGAKHWRTGERLLTGTGPPPGEVTSRAGDVLLLPKHLPHIATTPPQPGHSVHVVFALHRDHHPPTGAGH